MEPNTRGAHLRMDKLMRERADIIAEDCRLLEAAGLDRMNEALTAEDFIELGADRNRCRPNSSFGRIGIGIPL